MKEQKDTQDVSEQIQEGAQQASEQIQEGAQQAIEGAKREVQRARVPWYRAIWRGELLLVVDAIVLALFGLLAWWVHVHPILSVDLAITREFQENHALWLQTFMLAEIGRASCR